MLRSKICILVVATFVAISPSRGSLDVTSPSTSWTVISYANNNPDPSNDQQTGSSEGDIVGNLLHPSVYTKFDNAGTPSLTDGTVAFRLRLGADANPSGFQYAVFVGIDANADGKLDLFIGVNNSGSADTIGIWSPGAGANISPNTTTIGATPLASYTETASNYSFTAVNTTIDPSVGTATDLDGGGQTDFFLSFSVPLSDIITQLALKGIAGVNENSIFTYVVASSTQGNSLNQDLNGVGGTYDGSATWSTLGILSNPMTASGVVVPEPNAAWAAGALMFVLAIARPRRRRE